MSLEVRTIHRMMDIVHEPGRYPMVMSVEPDHEFHARVKEETRGLNIVRVDPFDHPFDKGLTLYVVTPE